MNDVKGLFRSHLEKELGKMICNELQNLFSSNSIFPVVISQAQSFFRKFMNEIPAPASFKADVIAAEKRVTEDAIDLHKSAIVVWINAAVHHFLGRQASGQLGINKIVRSATSGTGSLDLTIDAQLLNSTNGTNSVIIHGNSVRISGLDTFSTFSVAEVMSIYTLRQTLAIDTLNVTLNATISIDAFSSTDSTVRVDKPGGLHLEETIFIDFRLKDVMLDVAVLAALDRSAINNLTFASVYENPISCLLSTFYAINVSALNASVVEILPFQFEIPNRRR